VGGRSAREKGDVLHLRSLKTVKVGKKYNGSKAGKGAGGRKKRETPTVKSKD